MVTNVVDNLYKVQVGTEFAFGLKAITRDTSVDPAVDTPVDITGNTIECQVLLHHNKVATVLGTVTNGPLGECRIVIPSTTSADLEAGTVVEFRFRRQPAASDWIPMGVLQLEVI